MNLHLLQAQGQSALAPAPLLGDAPTKKPYGLEDAIADCKKMEAKMQEKLKAISEFNNDELIELLGLARFDETSSFLDMRFRDKVIMESLRRILISAKSREGGNEPKANP